MADDLPEDIDNLVHVAKKGGKIHFYAPRLHWNEIPGKMETIGATNYCPAVEWIEISKKSAGISKEKIRAEQKRILGLKKYYKTCPRCGAIDSVDRFNAGSGSCDSCAERHEGICF